MTVSIEIPSIFASYAGNLTSFEAEGRTVGECLKDLEKRYPDLVKLILAKDGGLLNSIDIFVNGESVYPRALSKPVKDGDKLKVIMIIQGG
jgi:molybdopterin converting factor small subunit